MSDRTLVVNLKEVVLNKRSQGDGFESENTAIGQLLGLSHLARIIHGGRDVFVRFGTADATLGGA